MSAADIDRTPPPAWDGPQEAIVSRVTSDGLFVLIDRAGRRFEHGPCRWSRPHPTSDPATDVPGGGTEFGSTLDASEVAEGHVHDTQHTHNLWPYDRGETPPAGTRCLVVRSDRRRWWVVAFDGWPSGGDV